MRLRENAQVEDVAFLTNVTKLLRSSTSIKILNDDDDNDDTTLSNLEQLGLVKLLL